MSEKQTMKCSVLLGKSFSLEKVTGKVIAKDQREELRVHASGGGGHSGYNAPVHVSSSSVTKGTLWLTDQDGNEFTWNQTNTDLGAREGHVISAAEQKNAKRHIAAYNHNLDRFEWWGCDSPSFGLLYNAIIFLPVCLLWFGILFSPESIEWLAEQFYETRQTIEIFLAVLLSLGWFFGSFFVCIIFHAIFRAVRKTLFSVRYRSVIESFLKENEGF